MIVSDEQLESFRKIYFEYYGREISKADAYDQASKLIRMMKVILKPISDEEWGAVKERWRARGVVIDDTNR